MCSWRSFLEETDKNNSQSDFTSFSQLLQLEKKKEKKRKEENFHFENCLWRMRFFGSKYIDTLAIILAMLQSPVILHLSFYTLANEDNMAWQLIKNVDLLSPNVH